MRQQNKKMIALGLLLLILSLGFFLRAANIENAPAGIYSDEAENGIDALKVYRGEQPMKLFYPGNNGREGLFMNLIALAYNVFGVTMFGFKFWSIAFGTLTVLGTYLLTAEMLRSRRAGLIAAFLVAVSFWSINFSRIAFRAVMMPAILTFSFYFLFRGIRTKHFIHFILSGFIFGLGVHTYIAFRIAPLILVILSAFAILDRRQFLKRYWKHGTLFVVAATIAAAPLLYDFYTHPEYVASRSGSISVLAPEVNQGKPLQTLARSLGLSFVKYTFWGDQNWRHNYPPYPVLDPIIGISFLVGLIYLVTKTFHLLYLRFRKGTRDYRLDAYMFLAGWFFVMHIPEFMTAEGLPHALRAIGALPAVYIIATLPILWVLGKAERFTHISRTAAYSLVAIILLFVGLFNIVKYHYFWANNPKQQKAFDKYLMEVSTYTKNLPSSTEKFLISDEYTSLPVKLMNANVDNMSYVWDVHIPYISPNTNDFVIIMTHPTDESFREIRKKFPNIKKYEHKKVGGGVYFELKP